MRKSFLSLVVCSFVSCNAASAQIKPSEVIQTLDSATSKEDVMAYYMSLSPVDKLNAKSWGLTEKEYGRYKYLLNTTARGVWTPNIDPITLLGVESRSEQERMKYARLFNKIELERNKKDIAFAAAQNADLKRLSPNSNAFKSYIEQREERRINYHNLGSVSQGSPDSNPEYQSSTHVAYIDLMKKCNSFCYEQIEKVVATGRVDMFFINAKSDAKIFQFIHQHNIDTSLVRSGAITLNYADEDKAPILPGALSIHKFTGNDNSTQVIL